MKRLSEETIQEIIQLYQAGHKPLELGKQFGLVNNSITRLLKKRGIERNQLIKITQEQKDYMVREYTHGVSSEKIAQELKIDGGTVCRNLTKEGIGLRPDTENHRKYFIDQHYFTQIDTQEKAYFLGMLYADGNVHKKNSDIKISLQEEDRDVLEKLSIIVYGYVKISEGKIEDNGNKYNTFYIHSKEMQNDLANLGCMPNKVWKIKLPNENQVPKILLPHFIRGYLDGDGCICTTGNYPRLDFTGNGQFIQELKIHLEQHLNIQIQKLGQRHEDTNTRNFQIKAKEDLLKVLRYIYQDATIYMQRKYNEYQKVVKFYQDKELNDSLKSKDDNIARFGTTYCPKIIDEYTDKEEVIQYIFDFYRNRGFPQAQYHCDEMWNSFCRIKDFDTKENVDVNDPLVITSFNKTGSDIIKHFSPHFFNISSVDKKSVIDAFHDDIILKKIIAGMVNTNETITGNSLKTALGDSRSAYRGSMFSCILAKHIYNTFTQDSDIVYDFSMGFGQRLLGALSISHALTYIGTDPWQKSVDSNQAIYDFIRKCSTYFTKDIDLYNVGSEEFCPEKYHNQVSLAFSSPCYFDLERYDNSEKQAYTQGYVNFIHNWWQQTVQNIYKLLKNDGTLIINIKEKVNNFDLAQDMINIAQKNNFELITTYKMQISKNNSFNTLDVEQKVGKYEPVYVFKKGK